MSFKIAISPGSDHRLAALFYDQVLPVAPLKQVLPDHMRFHGLDDLIHASVINHWMPFMLSREVARRTGPDGIPNIEGRLQPTLDNSARNIFARHIHRELHSRKISAVPLFLDDDSYQEIAHPGQGKLLEIVLQNAPVIDLNDLSWDHIEEVRQDPDFRIKVTRFLTCLQENYEGKSKSFVEDSVQLKVRDFEEVAGKKGLSIAYVTMKTLLDANTDFAAAAVAAYAISKGLSTAPLPTLLISGSVVLGKVGFSIYEKLRETSDKDGNEIALLVDVNKAIETKGKQ